MAPDQKYYIRAGAHSPPAPHFVVEALFARRGLNQPMLRPAFRYKPGNRRVVQLGIVSTTAAPALDVVINVDPLPTYLERVGAARFPLRAGSITRELPYFFDFHLPTFGEVFPSDGQLRVEYSDGAGRHFAESFLLEPEHELGPVLLGGGDADLIAKGLDELKQELKNLNAIVRKNQESLTRIASKFR
jgi:hypothetical protein